MNGLKGMSTRGIEVEEVRWEPHEELEEEVEESIEEEEDQGLK